MLTTIITALNIPQALQWVCYAVFTGYNTHTKVKKERHRKSEFGSSIYKAIARGEKLGGQLHSPLGGSGGMPPPPGNFENIGSLRCILVQFRYENSIHK